MDEAAKGPVCAGSPEGDGRLPTCSGRGLPVLPAGECPGKDLCQPAKGGELGDLEASTSGCSVMVDPHKYDPSKSACWRPGEVKGLLHSIITGVGIPTLLHGAC